MGVEFSKWTRKINPNALDEHLRVQTFPSHQPSKPSARNEMLLSHPSSGGHMRDLLSTPALTTSHSTSFEEREETQKVPEGGAILNINEHEAKVLSPQQLLSQRKRSKEALDGLTRLQTTIKCIAEHKAPFMLHGLAQVDGIQGVRIREMDLVHLRETWLRLEWTFDRQTLRGNEAGPVHTRSRIVQLFDAFYSTLYELRPEAKAHFQNSVIVEDMAFAAMIDALRERVHNQSVHQMATGWAMSHARLGIGMEDFDAFGHALILALKSVLKDEWSEEKEKAWYNVYRTILIYMIPTLLQKEIETLEERTRSNLTSKAEMHGRRRSSVAGHTVAALFANAATASESTKKGFEPSKQKRFSVQLPHAPVDLKSTRTSFFRRSSEGNPFVSPRLGNDEKTLSSSKASDVVRETQSVSP